MDIELARARLRLRANVAKAVRRQCGVEWSPEGYRPLRRIARMQQDLGRVPFGVTTIHLLRVDPRFGTALVEWEIGERLVQCWLPWISILRFGRRYGNTIIGDGHG